MKIYLKNLLYKVSKINRHHFVWNIVILKTWPRYLMLALLNLRIKQSSPAKLHDLCHFFHSFILSSLYLLRVSFHPFFSLLNTWISFHPFILSSLYLLRGYPFILSFLYLLRMDILSSFLLFTYYVDILSSFLLFT